MTETKGKQKTEIKTRQPQKKTQDTFANLRLPHPIEELLGLTQPIPSSEPTTAPTPLTAITPRNPPIAPERDFARVANSIVREAVAGGYFIGKSKQIYDFLYQKTRGAIVPVRSIRIPKPELMKGSNIGSERTLLKNLAHLKSIGLIEVGYTDGQHGGNEYKVQLPEEVGLMIMDLNDTRTPPTAPTPPHPRHAPQKVPPVPPVESGVGGVGSIPIESMVYSSPKTSFNTKREKIDDDAGARRLSVKLTEAEKELTGKISTSAERWDELADVLITELKIAAARTTVSNVPSFLSEHLRRRLWKVDKARASEIAAEARGREGQNQVLSDEEKQKCPDCAGTGFWYPEGMEKGVAKCKHERLHVS
jgi:hypothetical protein